MGFRVPSLGPVKTGNPTADRWLNQLVGTLKPVFESGTTRIQSYDVPSPTADNDGQPLVWNQSKQTFQYGAGPGAPTGGITVRSPMLKATGPTTVSLTLSNGGVEAVTSGGTVTVTLVALSSVGPSGAGFLIVNIGTGIVTVNPTGSDKIMGQSSWTVQPNSSVFFVGGSYSDSPLEWLTAPQQLHTSVVFSPTASLLTTTSSSVTDITGMVTPSFTTTGGMVIAEFTPPATALSSFAAGYFTVSTVTPESGLISGSFGLALQGYTGGPLSVWTTGVIDAEDSGDSLEISVNPFRAYFAVPAGTYTVKGQWQAQGGGILSVFNLCVAAYEM